MENTKAEALPDLVLHYEKISSKGEDALPTLLKDSKVGNYLLLSVYDGMGGAGSTTYEKESFKTGAAIASELAKKVNEELFLELASADSFNISDYPKKLEQALKTRFKEKIQEIDAKESRLKSSLIKRLPTTIAGIIADVSNEQQVKIVSFWAGDSRNFIIDGHKGMMLISKDDITSKGDSSVIDAPLSNSVNADTEFYINQREITSSNKIVLLSATDGCFGYFNSLLHFECQLLECILFSEGNIEEFKANLSNAIKEVTQDDFSMSILSLGYESFSELSKDIHIDLRIRKLEQWIEPLSRLEHKINHQQAEVSKLRDEMLAAQKNTWEQYKAGYESLIAES
jgi:hypothetical protein